MIQDICTVYLLRMDTRGLLYTGRLINYAIYLYSTQHFSFYNFESFEHSLGLVLRILTGEDWHHLLRDAMASAA